MFKYCFERSRFVITFPISCTQNSSFANDPLQIPEVEAGEAALLSTIPSLEDPIALYKSLKAHDDLADKALETCKKLREAADDREFNWKARITGDEEEEGDESKAKTEAHREPKYSTKDLARYMKDGILPR